MQSGISAETFSRFMTAVVGGPLEVFSYFSTFLSRNQAFYTPKKGFFGETDTFYGETLPEAPLPFPGGTRFAGGEARKA